MKSKKLIPALALSVCLAALGGCTNTDQNLSFYGYWHTNSIAVDTAIHETLVYDVTDKLSPSISNLIGYELSYSDGTYTTELKNENRDGKSIYVYKTSLDIEVTYSLNGESASFNDSVVTEITFLSENNGLRPLTSQKTVISASPLMGIDQKKLTECYASYHYGITTTYNEDGTAGSCSFAYNLNDENSEPTVYNFEIEDKYTYLDNEQLLFALRGLPASKTSAKVYTYSPYVERVQTLNVSFSANASSDFSFYKNGSTEKETNTISYRPVTIKLNEKFSGEAQTAYYAALTDPSNNTYRNVMLYYETPLIYSLGSLEYKLRSVNYN